MLANGQVFNDFALPTPTTWFYFSALLAVGFFFKFSRLLSIRNLDVLTIYLLVPGLLLLLENRINWYGYLWLLSGTAYFLLRCFLDLTLVRRPALTANLNQGGLAWMGVTFFISLVAVAARHPADEIENVPGGTVPVVQAQLQAEKVTGEVATQLAGQESDSYAVRFWLGRTLTILCHLAIVIGLIFMGYWHFQDSHAGLAAATFYLLLPYSYLLLPFNRLQVGQWHHVWPVALMIWALVVYRKPTGAGIFFGLATGTVHFPIFAVPAWMSFYGKRGAGRFALTWIITSVLAFLLWSHGAMPRSLYSALSLSDWQPWSEPLPGTPGFWNVVPGAWAYRLPVFILYAAFVIGTAFWPAPKNLAHLIALSAIVFLGIQFWYADQGGVHVFWYLPLLILLIFRPNLTDRQALPIDPDNDWVKKLGRLMGRITLWLFKLPNPPVQVG